MKRSQAEGYTRDEMVFLAELRRKGGRTCRRCAWLSMRGNQRGCFPKGAYRKFLSAKEYEAGCDEFVPRDGSSDTTAGRGTPPAERQVPR